LAALSCRDEKAFKYPWSYPWTFGNIGKQLKRRRLCCTARNRNLLSRELTLENEEAQWLR
jgi:hypothetical protein